MAPPIAKTLTALGMRDWASGGRAKFQRGKEHIADFERSSREFLEQHRFTVATRFDEKTSELSFVVDEAPALPPRLASITADAIHNLRAALDILWHQAWTQGKLGVHKEYFPMPQDAKNFEARFAKIKRDHHKAAVAALRKVEPWNKLKLLGALNEIDNKDKHELPILAAATHKELKLKLPPDVALEGRKNLEAVWGPPVNGYLFLEDGTDLGLRMRVITDGGPIREMESTTLTADIAFGRGEFLEGQAVLPTLEEFATIVQGAVDAFIATGAVK